MKELKKFRDLYLELLEVNEKEIDLTVLIE